MTPHTYVHITDILTQISCLTLMHLAIIVTVQWVCWPRWGLLRLTPTNPVHHTTHIHPWLIFRGSAPHPSEAAHLLHHGLQVGVLVEGVSVRVTVTLVPPPVEVRLDECHLERKRRREREGEGGMEGRGGEGREGGREYLHKGIHKTTQKL